MMPKTVTTVGPSDHGRRMSLDEFDTAIGQEGYVYELSRGVVIVSDVPDPRHMAQVDVIRMQFSVYRFANPGRIQRLGGSGECKILLPDLESERHPDVSVYKTPPPRTGNVWADWIPEIVVEVVSPSSEKRYYVEKREEYLAVGVREYWVVDADRQEVLVLRRSGDRWRERVLRPGDVYRTRLLPGFALDCRPVFDAAGPAA